MAPLPDTAAPSSLQVGKGSPPRYGSPLFPTDRKRLLSQIRTQPTFPFLSLQPAEKATYEDTVAEKILQLETIGPADVIAQMSRDPPAPEPQADAEDFLSLPEDPDSFSDDKDADLSTDKPHHVHHYR